MHEAKNLLLAKRKKPVLTPEGALSTGSTLLNLACTGYPDLGFLKGGYYFLVGDSQSGKTWLSMTCFAEATLNPSFKDYRLIFDDPEGGALMDIEHYFGKAVARRLEPPRLVKGKPAHSRTLEDFYYNLSTAIEQGDGFIYVLDSQDALVPKADLKDFAKQRKAERQGLEATGSYGTAKAKYHSQHLPLILSGVKRTNSILIIIGQTRENVGFGFDPKTRGGGKALRFYANLEIWTSVKEKIKRSIRGAPRTVGANCLAEVKKNRIIGKIGRDRAVIIPIYYGLGIDDIGSCVDYLIAEGQWKKVKKKKDGDEQTKKKPIYDARELLIQGTRNRLIAQIEEDDLENKVRQLTAQVWNEIEKECEPRRKRRYE